MSHTRIYQKIPLSIGTEIILDHHATQHLVKALRLKLNDRFTIFNGDGDEYEAMLSFQSKREYRAQITNKQTGIRESSCPILLGQSISRGERMDYAIQKSVELGVHAIQPLITAHIAVKMPADSFEKRQQHWQGVAVSAAEQCGRSVVPTVHLPITIEKWIPTCNQALRLVLDPRAKETLPTLTDTVSSIALLIGPEGGLSSDEIALAKHHSFLPIRLGSRILRTETAAVAAMTLLQYKWGDLV